MLLADEGGGPRYWCAGWFRKERQAGCCNRSKGLDHGDTLFVPAGVVAQAWRDGGRQTRLARLLGSRLCDVVVLDDYGARAAGQLCGATNTTDIVDSSVVVAARERNVRIITSDPDDLRRLDRHLDLVGI